MPEVQVVKLYRAANGNVPFLSWLSSLSHKKTQAIIRVRLDRIKLGNFGDFKFLGEGVFELRVDFGPGYRIYYGRRGLDFVILLCGGDKKRQQKDVEKAISYWIDYRRRSDETDY